jgi:hypothetical protein
MKSVWAAGRKRHLARLAPSPTPVHPPLPSAISDWGVQRSGFVIPVVGPGPRLRGARRIDHLGGIRSDASDTRHAAVGDRRPDLGGIDVSQVPTGIVCPGQNLGVGRRHGSHRRHAGGLHVVPAQLGRNVARPVRVVIDVFGCRNRRCAVGDFLPPDGIEPAWGCGIRPVERVVRPPVTGRQVDRRRLGRLRVVVPDAGLSLESPARLGDSLGPCLVIHPIVLGPRGQQPIAVVRKVGCRRQ